MRDDWGMSLASVTAEPTKLRATKVASDDLVGVDRENNRINGYVVCEQESNKGTHLNSDRTTV